MKDIDWIINDLKEAASKATSGVWDVSGVRAKRLDVESITINTDDDAFIFFPIGERGEYHSEAFNDANYVAKCSPSDILALIDEIESLRAQLKRLVETW